MIDYAFRSGGKYEDNIENGEALTRAFGKWKPEDGLSVLAFVERLGGAGGYALVEAADPKVVFSFASKFNVWVESKVVPVIDVGDSVPLGVASLAWAKSASQA
jgi:hypothetical protein